MGESAIIRTVWASTVGALSIIAVFSMTACARPPSTTVADGAGPIEVDKDVAFRTTYYFRVFDYCVARKLKNKKFSEVVVPLTDSLYRFRMTGKAATIFTDIKFESGTLKASEIDPFGAPVEYDPDPRRHRVISPAEVAADARHAKAMRNYEKLLLLYKKLGGKTDNSGKFLPPGDYAEVLNSLRDSITASAAKLAEVEAAGDGGGSGRKETASVNDSALRKKLIDQQVRAVVKALQGSGIDEAGRRGLELVVGGRAKDGTLKTPSALAIRKGNWLLTNIQASVTATEVRALEGLRVGMIAGGTKLDGATKDKSKIKAARDEVFAKLSSSEIGNKLTAAQPAIMLLNETLDTPTGVSSIHCPEDAPVRRGFQVLGPEGWRTFDQDERLLIAMSTSAKPLISTLKELSNRVLNAQARPEAELLPLARERTRMSEVELTLLREEQTPPGGQSKKPKDLAKAVCEALVKGSDTKQEACNAK